MRSSRSLSSSVRKLEFRGLTLAEVSKEFRIKEARYKKLWQVRLAAQMAELPEFDTIYRAVRRAFRHAGRFAVACHDPPRNFNQVRDVPYRKQPSESGVGSSPGTG